MSDASSYSASSGTSFSTGTGSSVISNENSDAGALAKLNDRDQDASIQDLLQQNKGFWDAAFSCLLLPTKNREVKGYRMLAFRVVFEYLQMFRLVFNTRFLWVIRTDLWIWKAIYWVLFRFLIWDMGYDKYVLGLYIICAVVLALAVLTIAVAVVLRKNDSSNVWLARLIWLLQSGSLLMFSVCWVAVLDYLVFMFECSWGHGNTHMHWHELECIKMPHLANMAFGMAVALLTVVIVACLSTAECSANLVSDNLMSSPVAETALKTTALKVIMVCVSTCLDELPKPQAVLMFICPCLSAYLQIRSSPYLLPWMNHIWTGLWASLVYTTGLQLVLHYYEPPVAWDLQGPGAELAFRDSMTWAVLYGIFPAVLLGISISWLVQRSKDRPLKVFEAASQEAAAGRLHTESASVLKTVYKFHSPEQVAFLARCVRRFDPVTDTVLPQAAAVCNLIIQCGLARFPNNPTVLLVYANYIIHVKKEPRAARQQLQLAGKGEASIFDRYAIFACNDVLKRNRDQSEGGLDLMAYVEFQRNYRACVKAHKLALLAQRAFWRSLLHDSLNLTNMLASFKNMEAAEQTAVYVYKRVLERYPQNGKLLKVYGRFQEWVLHDPHRAARSYAEAIKRGLGDNMLNLTCDDAASTGADTGLGKVTAVDEKLDGVVIIDASGVILMANKVAYSIFGYARGELDGKNVSILMPQPFSSKHDGFLHNYLATGQAKILNSMRDVVALKKDRTIFPLLLMVTRLSGQGQESVFMGVLRVAEVSPTLVRAWCTMTGTILCCDTKLEEWVGAPPGQLTGRQVGLLGLEPAALTNFVMEAAGPQRAAATAGTLKLQTAVKHRYLQRIDVEVDTAYAGTDAEPLLVLNFHSISETQLVLVVDDKQRILYASHALAKMLGVPRTQLTALPSLVMHPCAHLHKVWFKEMGGTVPPFSSCRAGAIVTMIAGNGTKIPVRLEMRTVEQERAAGAYHTGDDHVQHMHIVKVHKCTEEERLDSQSIVVTVDQRGTVLQTSHSPKNLFGFDPQSELIGRPLAAFINVFEEFRMQQQQQQGSSSREGRAGASFLGGSSGAQDQYSKLALQIGPGPDESPSSAPPPAAADDSMLLTLLAHAAQEGSEACYRVGVHSRVLQPEQIGQDRAATDNSQGVDAGGKMSLLHVLGKRGGNQLRPALMRIDVLQTDWTSESADNQGMRFKVQLMVTEHMRAVLELDERLKVVKADPTVGQMLGLLSTTEMRRQYIYKLVNLPADIRDASSILKLKSGKASALKAKHATQEVSVGPLMEVETTHADGQPVKLRLQAVGKEGTGNRLLLLRFKLAKPGSFGSLAALLHLCAVGSPLLGRLSRPEGASAAAPKLRMVAAAAVPAQRSLKLPAAAYDGLDEQEQLQLLRGAGHGGRAAAPRGLRFEGEGGDGEAASRNDGHSRVPRHQLSSHSNWEQLRSPVVSGAGGALRSAGLQRDDEARPAEGRTRFGSAAGGRGAPQLAPSGPGSLDEEAEDVEEHSRGAPLLASALGEDVGGLQGPTNDGASDMGSEDEGRLDIASASEAGDGNMEDEVTCDWRRAKRLRKILRQLESPAARGPLTRFWRGTWGVVAALLLAHIICYAVLASILTVRHTDVHGVQKLANAVDRSQMILLRANFIAKCSHVSLQHLAVCSPAQRETYITKSVINAEALQALHTGVYLGSDPSKVIQLTDPKLRDWWTLPRQEEVVFYSTDPPRSATYSISLWNLGNRYINAARDVNYASTILEMEGDALEHTRYWQYVMQNGKDSLYKAYAVSLDLYVLFCWEQLGGLANLLTGLLIAELVAVALAAMLFQLDSVRRVCKQRMACFSVFLALPSATLRSMATAPCQVDEDDANRSDDEDELDMMGGPGGGGGGQASVADAEATGGASSKAKSVRMAVDDKGTTEAAAGSSKAGKACRLLDKRKSKDDTGLQGWARKKYRVVRHAAHGVFNRVAKINGKKLRPARATFAAFLLPLLAWWLVAIVIYGISFQKVAMLQAPLTSLQSAAHVQFNIARTRMLANMIGFSDDCNSPEHTELVNALREELAYMRSEYFSMLYGGPVRTVLEDVAPVHTTSSLFRSSAVSDLFFKTTRCLRTDPGTCYKEGSPWYHVTHSGIDAMVQRLMQELHTFSKLSPANQTVEHSSYEYTWRVAATDLYEGLAQVSDAFVGTTMTALDELQQLHTYLLIATIIVFVAVVLVVLVPFRRRLVVESVRLAGLLSQLPQESDVEGHVKVMVIDAATGHKATQKTSQNWTLARGITAAAGAAARAAASRAAGAVSNVRTRMAEASAVKAAAQAEAGGWQQYEQEDDDAESSQPDWM